MADEKSSIDRSADPGNGQNERKRSRKDFIQDSASMRKLLNDGSEVPDELQPPADKSDSQRDSHYDSQRDSQYSTASGQDLPDEWQVF